VAEPGAPPVGRFDRDTAVHREDGSGAEAIFAAEVSPDWRAGRGPHGGYLAAILLRALMEAVADPARAPRSLTIHYARAPEPGPISIRTVVEREGRSLSTLSARMEQDGKLTALALAAFSVPWSGPEIADIEMPRVAPPDPALPGGVQAHPLAPPIAHRSSQHPRFGGAPFSGAEQPMEIGGWLGHEEPRPIDALSLVFFSDALLPGPFMRLTEPNAAPTIDLTVHFRSTLPRPGALTDAEGRELCLARITTGLIHEGFFEEDGVIWAADGTVLSQSRQLALLLPMKIG
jgi:acyl-coenzyme A thioesterase PaaI-like protein